MKRLTLFLTACLVAVLALFAANTRAQQTDTNQRTFMTFSTAVELPGVTLEPGSYEFRLAPMSDTRNVVQVLKKDDSKVMGQWTFVPAQRERASDDTVVMFKEAREGSTPAVQYWYYPGETVGKEFIYPKDQAQRIAARTGVNVRTDEGQISASSASASADTAITPAPAAEARSSASDATASDNRASASAESASTLRNGPAPAQPTAAAGSLTGNRGVPQADASAAVSTDTAPSANASADASLRNAPAPAQPTAAAGSLTGNRGVVGTSGSSDAAASADAGAQANRPVGTSGVAQAPAPQANTQAPAPQANRRPAPAAELPKTASPLPLSGLIGVLSLVAAISLRSLRA
jgi:hypothetical protein